MTEPQALVILGVAAWYITFATLGLGITGQAWWMMHIFVAYLFIRIALAALRQIRGT